LKSNLFGNYPFLGLDNEAGMKIKKGCAEADSFFVLIFFPI
jgi:hypothetical protein